MLLHFLLLRILLRCFLLLLWMLPLNLSHP
ncbi:Protein of unknown function [Pyronema omphalodes CBS 100304]|uniref:Uncharacterized protein n=1 Tax=Pyronema omphalodes (strain CBS 100304) TaxID=1076935 RepID=U4L099_PYROM|nr:Protein of unknown function [Pyronema omphalodes CBS 100304]